MKIKIIKTFEQMKLIINNAANILNNINKKIYIFKLLLKKYIHI